ncbi:CpaD family pilus assembly protein [Novosphingobium sp. 1949]|uniref:CpaD family pilus assembly protein n=1 Tax=Novosphingobium organovorum TaxID=2930092 RepID=A0ABT0BBU9_9SPHN|nr:CpaD family pilus assembly protein [Novosphingobium organovorum]MCJ2182328.1 CpaD family pilus assembly protein [Novosphingobium organovorum]
MRTIHPSRTRRIAGATLILALATALAGCGGMPTNRSMYSPHQPVVETTNYTLDLTASDAGLAYGEPQRLKGWLDAMKLKYGDKVYIEDPAHNPAARTAVAELASQRGILLSEGAPVTAGYVEPGTVRVILSRSQASVPSCPNWDTRSDFNPNNGLSSNYGCATNSNLAAMIANPDDLISGQQGSGDTTVMTSTKAIEAYRKAETTGKGNQVSETGTSGS